jgi:F0F1-type ATP synthase assembly protein I
MENNRLSNTAEQDFGELIKGAVQDIETLANQHVKLVKAELKEEARKVTQGAISLAISGAILLIGGVMLGITLALALKEIFPTLPWWGAFGIITVVICGLGAVALLLGLKRFDDATPLADQTREAIKEDVQWLKNPK